MRGFTGRSTLARTLACALSLVCSISISASKTQAQTFAYEGASASLPGVPATDGDLLEFVFGGPHVVGQSAAQLGLLPGDVIDAISMLDDASIATGATLHLTVSRGTLGAGTGIRDVFYEAVFDGIFSGLQLDASSDVFSAFDPACGHAAFPGPSVNTQVADGDGFYPFGPPPADCYFPSFPPGLADTEGLIPPGPPFNDEISALDLSPIGKVSFVFGYILFSLEAGSPTLSGANPLLPGGATPNDLLLSTTSLHSFFGPPPLLSMGISGAALGLVGGAPGCMPPACDDVDALAYDGLFTGHTVVSLAPGSPSIGGIVASAADLWNGSTLTAVPAASMGLAPGDDIVGIDSVLNSCPVAPMGDPDGDGFGACDNCPALFNIDQSDSDFDGLGDRCDPCSGDFDGDSLGAPGFQGQLCAIDLCPSGFDPSNANSDADGLGDVCDNCDLVANPDQADGDFDGLGDVCDNCPGVPNFSQSDSDNDGLGDDCDTCTDSDGDTFGDPPFPSNVCADDNCPTVSNLPQTDGDTDGAGDACDRCPGFDDFNPASPCEKLYSLDGSNDTLRVISAHDGSTLDTQTITAASGEFVCPDEGGTGLAAHPSTGEIYAILNYAGGDCSLDPTRTTFAGCQNTSACHTFDGNQAACEAAWHIGNNGPASCWYDIGVNQCKGCGPNNEGIDCTNTCAPPPPCPGDPSRTDYVGGPGNSVCHVHDGDQSSCEAAYHTSGQGAVATCWYDVGLNLCNGCGPNNQLNGFCTNTCPVCGDPARTDFVVGSGACHVHDGDQTSCEAAFHASGNCGTLATCWYDTLSGDCNGCGPSNEGDGLCANTCDPNLLPRNGRTLVTVDVTTGEATAVGNTGDLFAGIAFDDAGQLYGTTDDGACNPFTLFELDSSTGAATKLDTLLNPGGGESLGFNPSDGLLYRSGGSGSLETIDPALLTVTPLTESGFVFSLPFAMTYDAFDDRMLLTASGGPNYCSADATGEVIGVGNTDHLSKGLAFLNFCGNGTTDAGEQCDDGNLLDGDCCSSLCQYESLGDPCADDGVFCNGPETCDGAGACVTGPAVDCDDAIACTVDACNEGTDTCDNTPNHMACSDGNACTADMCDTVTGCENDSAPSTMCLAAGKASLQVRDNADDTKDQLKWKWSKGPEVLQANLGAPDVTTTYTLCVFDSTATTDALVAQLKIDPNTNWDDKDPKGWNYKDKTGAEDGVTKVQLKTGAATKSKAQVGAKGTNIPLPAPISMTEFFDQDPRITVQLVNDATSTCWSSVFTTSTTNSNTQYKAKY